MADVDSTHPDFDKLKPDWLLIRDAIEGETVVKKKGETYLPKPSGFNAQEDKGVAMYRNYQIRGKFPEILGPTLRGMVGIIHRVPADITLPEKLEPLRLSCTKDGQDLNALHERVTYEALATGRYGLLVDAPKDGEGELPFIAGYAAETIINWSSDGDFFVLDESHLRRDEFAWVDTKQYRVLELVGGAKAQEKAIKGGVYKQILYEQNEQGQSSKGEDIEPQMRGGKKLEYIPFIIVGSTDVSPDIDEIPMIGVARAAFTMYRLDTDYKWQMFMSGQETLFVYSDTQTPVTIVGAGVVINVPKDSKAEYVGPAGIGMSAHKTAIDDERQQAMIAGARIFDTDKKTAESGDALRIRFGAQTASLLTIAINSAKGLERALKACAEFVGANPDEVIVKPNLQFIDSELDPLKAKALMELWMGGAISKMTMFENLQRGGLVSYDRDFEEEEELMSQEIPDLQTPALAVKEKERKAAEEAAAKNAELQAKLNPKPAAVGKAIPFKPKVVAKK